MVVPSSYNKDDVNKVKTVTRCIRTIELYINININITNDDCC